MKVDTKILMRHKAAIDSEDLQVLTFEMTGCHFGVHTDQVAEIVYVEKAEEGCLDIIRLEEKINFGNHSTVYRSPKVLVLTSKDRTGILINEPENILNISLDLIHPLPTLIERLDEENYIWGICLIDNIVVYLLNCSKLCCSAGHKEVDRQCSYERVNSWRS